MRITTKVVQNNSLRNININKLLQDKLSQQMSTEKKVNRPSDDPIVAIRALRLRTNVNQITQYYEKNVPDAKSWLDVTEGAMKTMSEVLKDMYGQCTKGSNEYLTLDDRKTILTALKALKDEVYSTGNSDYAGRYVFTGYRTDTPLTFIDDTKQKFEITEQLDPSILDSVTYVETGDILDITDVNFNAGHTDEFGVGETEVHRIRLAYDDVLDTVPAIEIYDGITVDPVTGEETVNYVDVGATYSIVSVHDADNPYSLVEQQPDNVFLVKETGELLLGKNIYDKLTQLKDDPTTTINEAEIRVTYQKENWKEGDLKPEHYFACTTDTADGRTITYNGDYLLGISDEDKQTIEYDVGLNQAIRVNTTADEVFIHAIGRDVDDLIASLDESIKMEEQLLKLEEMLKNNTDPANVEAMEKNITAAEKALTYLKEKTQEMFEGGITKMQGHIDVLNFAVTENGTRGQRLELISNRLMSQKTNFETLKSENEDIDITDVAIKLSSAELTYSSALMATGKVLQNNLLNFI